MKKNTKFYLSCLLCLPTLWLFAQEQKDDSKEKEITEIIIQGKRQNEDVIPYQKLSGKELENLSSVSVADAIRYFSGIQLKDYGGIGGMKTVNIRGMGSQHVGVFYDGIQLGNAQNGIVDLGKFSLDNMESISLYNGQKSQIFQSAKDFGAAGSIYMVSKKPQFKGTKKTNLSVNYRSGSFMFINPSVLWEQKISENINSSVNVEYINSNGKYKFHHKDGNWDTVAIRQNGNISAFRAEAGLYGKLNKGKWNLKGYYYDSSREIPGVVIKNAYAKYQFGQQWDRNFFVQGSLEKEITSRYKILINGKYAHDFTHYQNIDRYDDKYSLLIDNTFKQDELYISTAQQYSIFPFWDISLSADYQYNTLDANLADFAYPKRNTELVALATSFHFNRFKFQTSILGTFVQEKVNSNSTSKASPDKDEFTPTAFISYKPFKRTDFSLHGFYKRIFRMPTFNDLYYTDMGNSLLKPEYTTQYDVGFNYNKDFSTGLVRNLGLVTDLYYNEVTDKIVAYPKGQQFRWTMLNFGKVRIRGMDISAQSSLLLAKNLLFNLKMTYTYEDAQNLTDRRLNYKDQIPFIPWNSGSLLLGLVYKDWNLSYSFIYTGERYNSPSNITANYVKEWHTHDVLISREISLRKLNFRAAVEINNIFDRNYDIVLNYPMPGRNYRVSFRINI